jgi:GntR family transcriptional regulator
VTGSQPVFDPGRIAAENSAPLYRQLKAMVQEAVRSAALKAGDAIPSERDVADLLKVSRVTVRRAFSELVSEGVLLKKQGSGTYVNVPQGRIEQPLSRLTSFSDDMKLRGLKTDADWLDRSSGLATPEEALKLSISPSEMVSRFHRLRRADGIPMAVELAVIPRHFLPDPAVVGQSLYEALEVLGARPVRALQRLHAGALNAHDAKLLDLPTGNPALFIERISYLRDGRIVEYTRSQYRGDSYDFVAELSLAPGTRS